MKKALLIFVVMAFVAAFADNPHITKLIELTDVLISAPANGDVLTYDATSAAWQNKQPAAPQGTQIVARFQVVDSTSDVPATVIFTPTEAGTYRINAYQETRPTLGSCPSVSYVWTDDYSSVPSLSNVQLGCSGSVSFGSGYTIPLRSVAAPVTVSVVGGGSTYSLYITVEKL